VTGWLVLSASQKSSVHSLAGTFHRIRSIRPAENRFLQAGKGAENTKEEFRLCFTEAEWALSRGGLKNPIEALPGLEPGPRQ